MLWYVRDDIPSKQIKLKFIENEAFEGFFVKINLEKKKWLLCCSYNPDKIKILSHLHVISKALDDLSKKYDNFIFLGDFNNEPGEKNMSNFLNTYHLKNIVKQKTCFKNPDRPSCINLILTNFSRSFQDTCTVETGLSDFHKLVVTVLKLYFPKQKPNIQTFRDYKRFQNGLFRSELDYELSKLDVCNLELEHFLNIFIEILNKHASIKKKYLRANQGELMSKELNKAIMTRSRLRNRYLKEKSADSKIAYDKQRNYCVNLLRRTKKKYFANINISSITDNKKFWKTVKPLFSDKISHKETINLAVNDTILSDDQVVADVFGNYFNNIVKNLLTVTNKNYPKEIANNVNLNLLDPVEAAILKFKNHPSLNAIRGKISKLGDPKFYFEYIFFDQTLKELEKLDPKKTSQMDDTLVKVIKGNKEIVAFFIHHNFNNSLSSSTFSTALKYADFKPVLKKDDKTNKENYRPISILPTLSKVYERLIYNQMCPYFDKLFSKFQWGFRKGFNDEHCLITMIEKWRRSVDGGGQAGALLIDLSKAFDCIDHELLIAKLYAYGFDKNYSYFIN